MSDHLQQTITALEQELESHVQSVSEIETALSALRRLASSNGHAPPRRISATRRGPAKVGRRSMRALKTERTNERTNEQKSGRRGTPLARRSLPDDAKGQQILDVLRAKSPRSPGELAQALKMPRPRLTHQLKPLLKSGAVIATGATMNRQISLAGRRPKEAP